MSSSKACRKDKFSIPSGAFPGTGEATGELVFEARGALPPFGIALPVIAVTSLITANSLPVALLLLRLIPARNVFS